MVSVVSDSVAEITTLQGFTKTQRFILKKQKIKYLQTKMMADLNVVVDWYRHLVVGVRPMMKIETKMLEKLNY